MIYLEILSSSDPLAIGLYEFEYDHVHIGRSKKNDLIFVEKTLPANFMNLHIIQDSQGTHLIARSLTRSPFFFINGKKVSGVLKIRPNDIIAFGDNQIKIVKFHKNREEDDLSQAFTNFAKSSGELRFALDFIEEVLLDFEKASDV
jgi:hypothetical protein